MIEKAAVVDVETAEKLLPGVSKSVHYHKGIYVSDAGGREVAIIKQEDGKYAIIPFLWDTPERVLHSSLIPFQRALSRAPNSVFIDDKGFFFHKKLFEAVEGYCEVDEETRKIFNLHVLVRGYQKDYYQGEQKFEAIKEIAEAFPELTFDGLWDIKLKSPYSIKDEAFEEELREVVERGRELERKISEKELSGSVYVYAHTSEGIRFYFSLKKAEEVLEAVKRARECIHNGQIIIDRLIGNTFSELDIDKMVEVIEENEVDKKGIDRKLVRKAAVNLTKFFYPEELIENFHFTLAKMKGRYKNGECIPEEWEEALEFLEENGNKLVAFTEYPELLKRWIVRGTEEILREAEAIGTAWIDSPYNSLVFIKQKGGGYDYLNIEAPPEFLTSQDCKELFYQKLIPLQKKLSKAEPEALLDKKLLDRHSHLIELVSRFIPVGEGIRNFYKFHETVFKYGMSYSVNEREVEGIRKLLEKFPELSFENRKWKLTVKTETLSENEIGEMVDRAELLREELQKKNLKGSVFLNIVIRENANLSFPLEKAGEILGEVKERVYNRQLAEENDEDNGVDFSP